MDTQSTLPGFDLHSEMSRAFAVAGGDLPPASAKLADCCGGWYQCIGCYGPKDLGKGPVYALDLLDGSGVISTVYVGSKQVVDKLAVPGFAEYVRNGNNRCLLWFDFTPRFSGKGEEMGYYTVKSHFSAAESGDYPLLLGEPIAKDIEPEGLPFDGDNASGETAP